MPEGWDAIKDAPDTLPDALAYYQNEGRVAVNVESAHGCTVGDPEAHYAFRAWHDLIHLEDAEKGTFDLKGEQWCADKHREEIIHRLGYTPEAAWFGALVQIEIVEQNRYFLRTGRWPEDPRAFALRWLKDRGFERPASLGGPINYETACQLQRAA
ncbi:hypothetical protein AB433_04195 [Croceicoccus naphthovorans]|uniref:Uncharacterized protein n=2 Tax=Croceicoccus naphthovorans TaxID=1348774 RepID=A0A0G3XCT2_9SPHN|nr:hypothetical protein AB433_04195 [Croceicoccus naphthovorans]